MVVSVKKIVLWRKEVQDDKPGILANALAPFAHAGTNIQVAIAYRSPGGEGKAAIELYPVTGKNSMAAAKEAGFNVSRYRRCWSRATIARA